MQKPIKIGLISSIGHRHSRLSSFGTSNFLKKIGVLARGYFICLCSSGPHFARAVALFVLCLFHSTGYWYFVCNQKALRRITKFVVSVSE